MIKVNNNKEIENYINENDMVILYFTGLDCGACDAIKLKLEDILKKYPKIKQIEISGERYPEVAAEYNVFSLPLMILFVDKKETIRIGRNVSMLDLEKNIKRYYDLFFN